MDQNTYTNALDFIGKHVTVTIDRQLGAKHPKHNFGYTVNYGFIANTLSPDGEELDAYVLNVDTPLVTFSGACVAIIRRTDDDDDKLVVIAVNTTITDKEIRAQTHFQEQHFTSVIIRE